MTDPTTPAPPPDPEAGWPPRFDNAAIGWSGLILLALFLSMAGWFRSVFDGADLLDGGSDASQHAAAYILFIVGVLCLHAGVWFAIIEARRPPPEGAAALGVDPTKMVTTVLAAFRDQKVSRVMFAVAFALLVLAAAGSGLIDVSVGEAASTTGG